MIAANDDLPLRVARLESSVESISSDLQEVRTGQNSLATKLDRMFDALTSTDGRAAERAAAVKTELRDEDERKGRERSDLFKNGLALIGSVAVVVAALVGPYLNKLDQTSRGQSDDSRAIAGVREVLAQQGADVASNRDRIDTLRERNRWQDEKLFELVQRVATREGADAARR